MAYFNEKKKGESSPLVYLVMFILLVFNVVCESSALTQHNDNDLDHKDVSNCFESTTEFCHYWLLKLRESKIKPKPKVSQVGQCFEKNGFFEKC